MKNGIRKQPTIQNVNYDSLKDSNHGGGNDDYGYSFRNIPNWNESNKKNRKQPMKLAKDFWSLATKTTSKSRKANKHAPIIAVILMMIGFVITLIVLTISFIVLNLIMFNSNQDSNDNIMFLGMIGGATSSSYSLSDLKFWLDIYTRQRSIDANNIYNQNNWNDDKNDDPFNVTTSRTKNLNSNNNHPQQTSKEQQQRDRFVIFYHIYMPFHTERKVTNNTTTTTMNRRKWKSSSSQDHAMAIVREQIGQIARSAAATKYHITVYYNIIGNAAPLLLFPNTTTNDNNYITTLCHSYQNPYLVCQLNTIYESADENVTLQQLYDYCASDTHNNVNTNHRVSYLHTKGSYHNNEKNMYWRRLLTDAAISEQCINPPNASCNVCGLQFFTQFAFFFPGNMFTAQCSYVRKLLPLYQYQLKQEDAIRHILRYQLRNQLKSSLLVSKSAPFLSSDPTKDYYGIDRYSNEHWIGHPDIVPCDMDPTGNLHNVFVGKTKYPNLQWSMVSVHNIGISIDDTSPTNTSNVGNPPGQSSSSSSSSIVYATPSLRHREVLLLPGNLIKWYMIYNQAPMENSWIWDFFPDGTMWKHSVVHTHNGNALNAVDMMTRHNTMSIDGASSMHSLSSFYNGSKRYNYSNIVHRSEPETDPLGNSNAMNYITARKELRQRRTKNVESQKSMSFEDNRPGVVENAIFYHIAIPDGWDKLNENVSSIVEMQLTIINASYAAAVSSNFIPLYYTIAGPASINSTISKLLYYFCANDTINVDCHILPSYDYNYEGETLRQLYQYCKMNPSHKVSYIHNQGPVQLRYNGRNRQLIRHMTMAVTSNLCMHSLDDDDDDTKGKCNVCGLVFYMLWTFFFPGNMFAASCSYVNSLMEPYEYENRMRDYIGIALLTRLRTQFRTNMFPDRMDYFGLDRHAIEFWIYR